MPISIRAKRGIVFTIILVLLMGILLSVGFAHYLVRPCGTDGPDQLFVVPEGASLTQVAASLEQRNIVSSKRLFSLWGRVAGYGNRIKAGEYRLNSGMSPSEILGILSKGLVVSHPVTIPEGFDISQIAQELEKKGLAEKEAFTRLATDPSIAMKYGLPGPTLEGYLYPDTYRFFRGQSPSSIIDIMVKRFFDIISPLRKEIEASGMSIEQIITLASVIEKETGRDEERPIIASVFLNRLKTGMRLESDPTVIYGIRDFDGNLTKKDLKESTPYNTYVIQGLPPGPIASPGKAAIRAVLAPAETDFLYFVSKNDGSHHFSRTLAEHNRAVNTYQRKGRKKDG